MARKTGLREFQLSVAERLRTAATRAQLASKLKDIISAVSVAELHARIDQAARTIHTHRPNDARTIAELRTFDGELPDMKTAMTRIKNWAVPTF